MTKEEVRKLLEKQTKAIPNLDVNLLLALIEVESSFNPWVIRVEQNYNFPPLTPATFAAKHMLSLDTEKQLQKCSFGLFQIMGLGSREIGFKDNLTKLLDPEVNVIWGVEFFRVRCVRRYTKIADQVAAYNAGTAKKDAHGLYLPSSTQNYVAKVLDIYEKNQVTNKESALLC